MPPTGASEEAPVCYRHPDREAHIRCQRCGRPICPDCMIPAAVGFQCPECVREGSRQTRSGRTAYGGQRSGNPALTSQVLIGINVVVWLAILLTGASRSRFVDVLGLRPDSRYQGVLYPQFHSVAQGDWWQLVTSVFTHVTPLHIGFNMLALYTLGPGLEAAIGRTRFLLLYVVSGLAGSATVLWLAAPYSLTLGASGAVFGLLGALLVMAIKLRGDVRSILTWVGINFVLTVVVSRISWQGHLGGFVAGLVIGAIVVYAPKVRRATYQFAGIGAVALIVLVAVVTRVAVLA